MYGAGNGLNGYAIISLTRNRETELQFHPMNEERKLSKSTYQAGRTR